MKHINIIICLLILIFSNCSRNKENKTAKVQKRRTNIINVQDKINNISTIDIKFSTPVLLNIIDSIFIVSEIKSSKDKHIHLFNKHSFEYITSTGVLGKGPGEITRPGYIGINNTKKVLWVQDHGKRVMWKLPLDSILNNEMFKPIEKVALQNRHFIERFGFLNDSIVLGMAVNVHNDNSFEKTTARFNLNSSNLKNYGYSHPRTSKKKSYFDFELSLKNNCYVKGYSYCDLITICDLNGNLKYNVYGPEWNNNPNNTNEYFTHVKFYKDYIITSYNGDSSIIFDKYKKPQGTYPSKLIIFGLDGNYIKTINTEFKFSFFCVDEDKQRIIAYFVNKKNPIGYFKINLK